MLLFRLPERNTTALIATLPNRNNKHVFAVAIDSRHSYSQTVTNTVYFCYNKIICKHCINLCQSWRILQRNSCCVMFYHFVSKVMFVVSS